MIKQPRIIPYTSLKICFIIQPCAVTLEVLSTINVVIKAGVETEFYPVGWSCF